MWENEEKDGAQVKRQTAEDYEYSTLMQLLGVSVSKHLLDEHFTLIWANDFYYQLIGWPKEEYEKVKTMGLDYIQGYYFGKPQPFRQFKKNCENNTSDV